MEAWILTPGLADEEIVHWASNQCARDTTDGLGQLMTYVLKIEKAALDKEVSHCLVIGNLTRDAQICLDVLTLKGPTGIQYSVHSQVSTDRQHALGWLHGYVARCLAQ